MRAIERRQHTLQRDRRVLHLEVAQAGPERDRGRARLYRVGFVTHEVHGVFVDGDGRIAGRIHLVQRPRQVRIGLRDDEVPPVRPTQTKETKCNDRGGTR